MAVVVEKTTAVIFLCVYRNSKRLLQKAEPSTIHKGQRRKDSDQECKGKDYLRNICYFSYCTHKANLCIDNRFYFDTFVN